MDDYLSQLPKAELHLHLEGTIGPGTLRELDPAGDPAETERLFAYRDFEGFLKAFGAVVKRLATPDAYAHVTRKLLAELAAQNVRYAEITVSAGVVLWKKQEFAPVFDAIEAAAVGSPVHVRWILDAVRQFGEEEAMKVAHLAAERVGRGVVAFGIGGNEERGPAEWFGGVFNFAREAGLRLTAHAGESMGPESIWAALKIGAERIGHGVTAVRDERLMAHLKERDVPLEICVTSNRVTGVVPRVEDHPLRRLYDAGVPIVINSDDPGMFGCTLTGEFRLAARQFGFSDAEMRGLAANGFRYAFACPAGLE